jgi:hypothetical protein
LIELRVRGRTAMQQIADWLEKLGVSEYSERFSENKIDVSVLRHLTDQDLNEIGVPLGHRRKMLAAISEFLLPRSRKSSKLSRSLTKVPSAAKSQ